ncbi:MAG TPA: RHS repeat-associated core domain-containing protein, partial [Acidimicrobiales bacterium]|nr:RHS repeat-associated core domain-containing protein [Acidimicrobiales bacterium]
HYDPATGQFTSVDPIVAVTEEPYGYVGGNPANGADPTGYGCSLYETAQSIFSTRNILGPRECGPERKVVEEAGKKLERPIEKYADDAAMAASGVGLACLAGSAINPGLLTCASVAGIVSNTLSIMHMAATCAGGLDKYCRNAMTNVGLSLVTAGLAKAVGVGARGFATFAEMCAAEVDVFSKTFDNVASVMGLPLSIIPDTTERPG